MEGNAGRVHKAFTYSSRYFIVMDLTVLEAHETTTHYNASTLPNKSGKGSVLGSFFDRGAFEESLTKVQESKRAQN